MRIEQKTNLKTGIWRLILALFAVGVQVGWIINAINILSSHYRMVSIVIRVATVILVLVIYGYHTNSSFKMPWLILILAVPLAGTVLFLLFGIDEKLMGMRKRFRSIDEKLFPLLPENEPELIREHACSHSAANISHYLKSTCHFPVYCHTDVRYFPEAIAGLEAQIEDLKKARSFIFLEYHAIENSVSFHRILQILEEKAAEGLDVRVFYDDIGSMSFLRPNFPRKMEEKGIPCRVFNRIIPFLDVFMNNRDHRKITVIDGKIGYTGGYNLANEYFNLTSPHGYWKDTGIRLEGDAVHTLTLLFLEMWNAIHNTDSADSNLTRFFPDYHLDHSSGFIQPYADSPLNDERVGESVYLNIINRAREYVYFTTPYLIITDEMSRAFQLAAKRGVEVRIVTPGIPDKRIVYACTRSYYAALARAGVRIYEYTPGFIHAKQCISDNDIATVGTINLDFRSLYHHFENGCLIYKNEAISGIYRDFTDIFNESREVTDRYSGRRSRTLRIGQCMLRLIAPLL